MQLLRYDFLAVRHLICHAVEMERIEMKLTLSETISLILVCNLTILLLFRFNKHRCLVGNWLVGGLLVTSFIYIWTHFCLSVQN